MQDVVVASRCDVPDVYHRVCEWLTSYSVFNATLYSDVGLLIMKPGKLYTGNCVIT